MIVAFLVALSVLRSDAVAVEEQPAPELLEPGCLLGGGMSATGLGLPMSLRPPPVLT